MSSRPPSTRVVRAARRGATSRSRSPQTTSVGTRTRAADRPQRLAPPPAAQHRLRGAVERLVAPRAGGCGRRARRPPRRGGARWRALGSPKHSRTTLSMRSRLVIAASPSRARRPAGPGSDARSIRGSDTRRGSGRRSGIAGETSVSERTSSGRRAATMIAIAPPSELPSRCTGTAAPGEEAQQRVGVPGRRVVGRGGRAGEPEAGQVDGQAGRAGREQAREVGPVGARSGESVHVDGLDVGRSRRLAHVQGDAARGDLPAGPGAGVGVAGRQGGGVGERAAAVVGRGRDTSVASGRTASDDSVITRRA